MTSQFKTLIEILYQQGFFKGDQEINHYQIGDWKANYSLNPKRHIFIYE